MEDHIHRNAQVGAWVLINESWYYAGFEIKSAVAVNPGDWTGAALIALSGVVITLRSKESVP